MSVKVRISYQDKDELRKVMQLLHPAIKSYKITKGQQGAYKRAYIEIK